MRSLLFVPADSPKKLDKAMTSGADGLIVDLEDSVADGGKEKARAGAAAFLKNAIAAKSRPRLFVRINGLASGLADTDLDALVPARPDGIVLPKAEGGASIAHLDAKLTAREAIHGRPDGGIEIFAFAIESAKALFLAGTYAGASPRLIGLTWGSEDLTFDLGAEVNRGADGRFLDPYRLARSLCLAASAAAQVQAIDTVYADFRNGEGLHREAQDAAREGFVGKMAIHPAQVAIINEAFTPTAEAITRARKIVAAFAAKPQAGTVGIDGVMYDRPHLLRAEQLLERVKVT
jgi:citrate lyase subunit beta/citryl-CoA lyase